MMFQCTWSVNIGHSQQFPQLQCWALPTNIEAGETVATAQCSKIEMALHSCQTWPNITMVTRNTAAFVECTRFGSFECYQQQFLDRASAKLDCVQAAFIAFFEQRWRRHAWAQRRALMRYMVTVWKNQCTYSILQCVGILLRFTCCSCLRRFFTRWVALFVTGAVFLEISVIILRGRRSTSDMSHCVLHTLHSTLYTPHSTRYALYTLHSTLHTPQSILHTLHSTLHTPHSTLHTLHFTLHTPHFTLHTPHSTLHTLYTLHSTLYTPHSTRYTLYTLLSTLHTPHSTLHTPHFAVHTPHSTLYTLYSTLHTLHSTLYHYTLHFTLYTPHFTLYTPHSPLYTPHSTLYTPRSTHF